MANDSFVEPITLSRSAKREAYEKDQKVEMNHTERAASTGTTNLLFGAVAIASVCIAITMLVVNLPNNRGGAAVCFRVHNGVETFPVLGELKSSRDGSDYFSGNYTWPRGASTQFDLKRISLTEWAETELLGWSLSKLRAENRTWRCQGDLN